MNRLLSCCHCSNMVLSNIDSDRKKKSIKYIAYSMQIYSCFKHECIFKNNMQVYWLYKRKCLLCNVNCFLLYKFKIHILLKLTLCFVVEKWIYNLPFFELLVLFPYSLSISVDTPTK